MFANLKIVYLTSNERRKMFCNRKAFVCALLVITIKHMEAYAILRYSEQSNLSVSSKSILKDSALCFFTEECKLLD